MDAADRLGSTGAAVGGTPMSLRVAIVGYGAVADVHAAQLRTHDEAEAVAVYGPSQAEAGRFARRHCIDRAADSLEEALSLADAALICSPSFLHFEQATASLNSGCHTLVELPATVNVAQIDLLARLAERRNRRLSCAHTSRYLVPFQKVGDAIRSGELGEIQQIVYLRHLIPKKRGWSDDALLHHAQHPIDLLLAWFGYLKPLSSAALPLEGEVRNISLLGRLENGAPVSVSISYDSKLPQTKMIVVGSLAAVETDGFSFLQSSIARLEESFDEEASYHDAIRRQDLEFFAACQGRELAVPWSETRKVMSIVSDFRKMRVSTGVGALTVY